MRDRAETVDVLIAASRCRIGQVALVIGFVLLVGCATRAPVQESRRRPTEVRAEIVRLLPTAAKDKEGWATDITAAFAALEIAPRTENLCATLAVVEQESSFAVDPVVPNLGKIARAEIDRRADQHNIPQLLVRAALSLDSSSGKSYAERIAAVRTERELSLVYDDFIGRVPMGRRLFADNNPVRTGGPMQVSVAFAEKYEREHSYPYPNESIRYEVFSRRGGVYFGVAHLLGFPVSYDRMIYRFADYNAGFYASRNAAFQNAVSLASGVPLALDGDLVDYEGSGKTGATELALRSLERQLDLSDSKIHRALVQGETLDFEDTDLYRLVFALAEKTEKHPLPRALVPRIALKSPKITRKLTTEWFADRVDQRYRACLAKSRR